VKLLQFILSLVSLQLQVYSQQDSGISAPLKVYGSKETFSVSQTVSCYIDTSEKLTFYQIQSREFNDSYLSLYKRLTQSSEHAAYWLKFAIHSNSDSTLKFHLYCGSVDFVDLYFVSPGYPVEVVKSGTLRPHLEDISYEEKMSGTLPIKLLPHQQGEIFISLVQKTQEFDFNGIEIYDQNAFYASFYKDVETGRDFTIFQILFQGFLLSQILYVLFQWMMIRRKEYFYYFLYLLVISLYFLSKYESLYGVDLLFSRLPILKVYLSKTLLIVPYFLYFRFVRTFLEIPANYKALNRWIVWLEYFLLAYIIFDLVFIVTTFNVQLQSEIFTYVFLLVFILATSFIIYMFRQRQVLVYYVLTGSFFVGVGNILGLVFTYLADDVHVNLGFHNMLLFSQVGVILEIICFTSGLGYKSRAAEKEKLKSQKKLIEQLKANEVLQLKMQNIRNKIAQDLHDDIGSTLSSISILSELILKDKCAGQTIEMIGEIKDSSVTLMEKMDDIIWSINPKNDSLENLLLRIKRFASNLFEARSIEYSITIQEHIDQLKFSMEYRQHIYLILKESINNLVKYSKATMAVIDVSFDQCVLEIHVKDNGIGFVMSDNFEGNGILSMKNRAALMQAELMITTKPGEGTNVLLKVKIE
jgi:signal transduction histidine kinase